MNIKDISKYVKKHSTKEFNEVAIKYLHTLVRDKTDLINIISKINIIVTHISHMSLMNSVFLISYTLNSNGIFKEIYKGKYLPNMFYPNHRQNFTYSKDSEISKELTYDIEDKIREEYYDLIKENIYKIPHNCNILDDVFDEYLHTFYNNQLFYYFSQKNPTMSLTVEDYVKEITDLCILHFSIENYDEIKYIDICNNLSVICNT